MASQQINPLTQDHCDCLNRVLESTAFTHDYLQKCKSCGIPVDELIQQNNDQRQQAERLKATFFPNAT